MKTITHVLYNISLYFCVLSADMSLYAKEAPPQRFQDVLYVLGERLDCYFTVESVGVDFTPLGYDSSLSLNNPVLDSTTSLDFSAIKDVDEVVTILSDKVTLVWPDAFENPIQIKLVADKVMRDGKTIIRIRDSRLKEVTNYVLIEKVSFQFEGKLEELQKFLMNQYKLLKPIQGIDFAMIQPTIDIKETIKVHADQEPIRDVLTKCIPLEGYNRVLWGSFTDGKKDSPVVVFRFHGINLKQK